MRSTFLYVLGFVAVLIGLTYAAHLLGVPSQWIAVGALILVGMGLMKVSKSGRNSRYFR